MAIEKTINRSGTIGGSEMGKILTKKKPSEFKTNCNCLAWACDGSRHYRFESSYETYLHKIGELENPFKGNSYTKFGDKFEPLILNAVNEILGTNYQESNNLQHPTNKRIITNLDGLDITQRVPLLEIKTTGFKKSEEKILEAVKKYYEQPNIYAKLLSLNGVPCDRFLIAVYFRPEVFHYSDFEVDELEFNKDNIRIWEVEVHKEFQDYVLEKMHKLTELFDIYEEKNIILKEEEYNKIFFDNKKPRKKMVLKEIK